MCAWLVYEMVDTVEVQQQCACHEATYTAAGWGSNQRRKQKISMSLHNHIHLSTAPVPYHRLMQ